MLKALRGQIPMLLRHPSGAAVVAAAFTAASSAQRNAMAVEFYGRELSLFAVRILCIARWGRPSRLLRWFVPLPTYQR